jgi:hypothetical protein
MPKSKINSRSLEDYFNGLEQKVFSFSDLATIFVLKDPAWNLPKSMTAKAFIGMLLNRTKLSEVKLQAQNYPVLLRYTWGTEVSPIAMAISIKHDAYFCHGSAMWIHRIGGTPDEIYINCEQSKKIANRGVLLQTAIDRAFRNAQRRSKLTYRFNLANITVLSGKNSERMEVQFGESPSGEKIEVTSLERTLIDIAVRPAYAGGIANILEAFRLARGKISVAKLLGTLKLLDYMYPFHQSIGFYMKRSGYGVAETNLVKQLGSHFDFYLDYGMENPAYDSEFRVFYPKSLSTRES